VGNSILTVRRMVVCLSPSWRPICTQRAPPLQFLRAALGQSGEYDARAADAGSGDHIDSPIRGHA
jgi:hypothetical protein